MSTVGKDITPDKSVEEDVDLDELFRIVDELYAARKLRKERPWTSDIIRVLWGRASVSMDQLTKDVAAFRRSTNLPTPQAFAKTVQSCLNQHTSQSSRFSGNPDDDLFFSPKGKGSGTWAVRQGVALRWLKARSLPPA